MTFLERKRLYFVLYCIDNQDSKWVLDTILDFIARWVLFVDE